LTIIRINSTNFNTFWTTGYIVDKEQLTNLLQDLYDKKTTPEEAVAALRDMPFKNLDLAKIDYHRTLRKDIGEVVFCQGKSNEQLKVICENIRETDQRPVLYSRVSPEQAVLLKSIDPDLQHNQNARMLYKKSRSGKIQGGTIMVVSGGTADIPVAEEAACTAEIMGNMVTRHYDVGVAGIHRLFAIYDELVSAQVIVAVAGMEGALPSIVSGLVNTPVICIPTSVGYGANFKGLSALLTMLNSCSPGMSVVNIDNGFGGGYMASLINNRNLT
jgi:NCAIR mutase (PurE)-related protein